MSGRSRGNQSIYPGKTTRVQGVLTKTGARAFERTRKELAQLVGVKSGEVSDGDTIEYLARVHADDAQHAPKPAWAQK